LELELFAEDELVQPAEAVAEAVVELGDLRVEMEELQLVAAKEQIAEVPVEQF
jgi:hypothetical protein